MRFEIVSFYANAVKNDVKHISHKLVYNDFE